MLLPFQDSNAFHGRPKALAILCCFLEKQTLHTILGDALAGSLTPGCSIFSQRRHFCQPNQTLLNTLCFLFFTVRPFTAIELLSSCFTSYVCIMA
jgi:hypothetical protein